MKLLKICETKFKCYTTQSNVGAHFPCYLVFVHNLLSNLPINSNVNKRWTIKVLDFEWWRCDSKKRKKNAVNSIRSTNFTHSEFWMLRNNYGKVFLLLRVVNWKRNWGEWRYDGEDQISTFDSTLKMLSGFKKKFFYEKIFHFHVKYEQTRCSKIRFMKRRRDSSIWTW